LDKVQLREWLNYESVSDPHCACFLCRRIREEAMEAMRNILNEIDKAESNDQTVG
jgi:hypothetical protein